jgi:hypothetical protein
MTATTSMKRPTPLQFFTDETCLLIDMFVKQVVDDSPYRVSPGDLEFFTDYCSLRFRWYYANKPDWKKWMDNRNPRIDPRSQCNVWIRHWLAGFVKDPDRIRHEYESIQQ